jgi:hypothetical protein
LDKETMDICTREGVPAIELMKFANLTGNFRSNPINFRNMGLTKVGRLWPFSSFLCFFAWCCSPEGYVNFSCVCLGSAGFNRSLHGLLNVLFGTTTAQIGLIQSMLGVHGIRVVCVSDTDAAWQRHPGAYIDAHPSADILISTDCLSHEVDVGMQARHNQPRCGHVPDNTWGLAFNTGIIFFRNTDGSKYFLKEWEQLLGDPSKANINVRPGISLIMTDQLAFNQVFDRNFTGSITADKSDPRTIWGADKKVRIHPLPVLTFASGHVAFVQRLPEK